MADYTLTTGDDTFTGTSGDDVFSGPEGGVDVLGGGGGNDLFELGLGNAGTVDGGAGIDTVRMGILFQTTFTNVEVLEVRAGYSLASAVAQLNSFDVLRITGSSTSALSLSLESGAGGTLNLGALVESGHAVHITNNFLTSSVVLTGTARNDTLQGTQFDDTIHGGAGDDEINGGGGANYVDGGDGNDSLYHWAGDTTLGGAGDDIIRADYGGGVIDGGGGYDILLAGDIRGIQVTGIEALNTYVLRAGVADLAQFPLINGVQVHLYLSGAGGTHVFSNIAPGAVLITYDDGLTSGLNLTGSAGQDLLFGSTFDDTLVGGLGDDEIDGKGGSNTLSGGEGNDTIWAGFEGVQTITGNGGDDTFRVADATGTIDGGAGIDTVTHGSGSADLAALTFTDVEVLDIYLGMLGSLQQFASFQTITNSREPTGNVGIVLTGAGGAFDPTLQLTPAHSLVFEGNRATSAVQVRGTVHADHLGGTYFNDTLTGADGADTLQGHTGDDLYVIDAGDVIVEFFDEGNDTIQSQTTVNLAAWNNVENITLTGAAAADAIGTALDNRLTGNDGANRLVGGAGADTLSGGTGADTLEGGTGNDWYINPTSDTIIERAGQGFDRIISDSSFSLATLSYVERLELTGNIPGFLRGNNFANHLIGNAGSNTMSGFDGDDAIFGGGGRDTITGGMGRDQIAPGLERDTIVWNSVAESTGATRDFVSEFIFSVGGAYERLDFPVVPTAVRTTIMVGSLSEASFDADLQAAVNASNLGAGQAVLFDPNGGDLNLAGHIYLIVDANGVAGYQAGADYVVQFTSWYGTLTLANFI